MTELFISVINMSISAGWMILAVMLIRAVFRKAPKWLFPVLWGFVGIRLVCPLSFESIFSLIPSANTVTSDIMYQAVPAVTTGVPAINMVVNPVIAESFAPNPLASANPLQILIPVFSLIWLSGIVIMFLYMLISLFILKRKVSGAVLINDNVYTLSSNGSPFVTGFFRPRIYLPQNTEESGKDYVLMHEKAHIKRFDHITKPIGFVILAFHWFNPLVWLSYFLMCRDIEFACDEYVVSKLSNEQKADYSEALLYCGAGRRLLTAPVAFCETGVKKRVKNILSYKKHGKAIIAVTFAIALVFAVMFLTNPPKDILPINGEEISGVVFKVDEYLYDSTIYSFSYQPYDLPVRYVLMPGKSLYIRDDMLVVRGEHEWTELDGLSEIRLTEENFDAYFRREKDSVAGWHDGAGSAAEYRKNNRKAWRVISDRVMYYLLLQNDGYVYLACGYYDENNVPGRSEMRWMFSLKEADGQYNFTQTKTPSFAAIIKDYDRAENTLTVDFVEYITAEDTERVIELGLDFFDMPDGYYIHNPDTSEEKIGLSDETMYKFFDWHMDFPGNDDDRYEVYDRWVTTNNSEVFEEYLDTYEPYPGMPFFFYESRGKIVSVEEMIMM